MRRAAALAAAALACSACGSGGGDEPRLRFSAGGGPGADAAAPGQVVLRFVQAAAAGDARTVWGLLSAPTRASYGPTFDRFARGSAPRFTDDFERVGTLRVVLSRALGADWAVGAVVGRYTPEDGEPEPAAYAAALRREDGRWRIELGGLVIERLDPGPNDETGPRPVVAAEAQAAGDVDRIELWLDGRHLTAPEQQADPFTARVHGVPDRALAPGLHVAVVFAATPDTAGAVAWPFEVRD